VTGPANWSGQLKTLICGRFFGKLLQNRLSQSRHFGAGFACRTVGISVFFPIFTVFSYTYRVRQAEATVEQREMEVIENDMKS